MFDLSYVPVICTASSAQYVHTYIEIYIAPKIVRTNSEAL